MRDFDRRVRRVVVVKPCVETDCDGEYSRLYTNVQILFLATLKKVCEAARAVRSYFFGAITIIIL